MAKKKTAPPTPPPVPAIPIPGALPGNDVDNKIVGGPQVFDGGWDFRLIRNGVGDVVLGFVASWKPLDVVNPVAEFWRIDDYELYSTPPSGSVFQIGWRRPSHAGASFTKITSQIVNYHAARVFPHAGLGSLNQAVSSQFFERVPITVNDPANHGNPSGYNNTFGAPAGEAEVYSGLQNWSWPTPASSKLTGRMWRRKKTRSAGGDSLDILFDQYLLTPSHAEPKDNGDGTGDSVFIRPVTGSMTPAEFISSKNVNGNWIFIQNFYTWMSYNPSASMS